MKIIPTSIPDVLILVEHVHQPAGALLGLGHALDHEPHAARLELPQPMTSDIVRRSKNVRLVAFIGYDFEGWISCQI